MEIGRLLKSQHTLKDHETSIVDKSGRKIPILLSASEITADNGQVIGSVGFFEDQRQKRLARDVNEYLVRLQTQAQSWGRCWTPWPSRSTAWWAPIRWSSIPIIP